MMADFLGTLVGRALGTVPMLRPMPAAYRPGLERGPDVADPFTPAGPADAEPGPTDAELGPNEISDERDVATGSIPTIVQQPHPTDPGTRRDRRLDSPQREMRAQPNHPDPQSGVPISRLEDSAIPSPELLVEPPAIVGSRPAGRATPSLEVSQNSRPETDSTQRSPRPSRPSNDSSFVTTVEGDYGGSNAIHDKLVERTPALRRAAEQTRTDDAGDTVSSTLTEPPRRAEQRMAVRLRREASDSLSSDSERAESNRLRSPRTEGFTVSLPESRGGSTDEARDLAANVVTVTIGRLEIKAAPTSRSSVAGNADKPAPERIGPTLAEYLAGGRGGRRS
jgi:hypothetical protein